MTDHSEQIRPDSSDWVPMARDVCEACPIASVEATTRDVQAVFESHPELLSLPVVDGTSMRPIGMINRAIFMTSMARPFYKEIFSERSCLVFMDKGPLVVEAGLPLDQLSVEIATAGDKVISDGFIIVAGGRFIGVGHTQTVLRIMADLHHRHSQRLSLHRANLESLVLKRTQALSEARDAAEAAARTKASFLANMSHEIRTPMNAIIGMAYLIKKEGLPVRQGERLEKIESAARHLLTIINDILDLTKIGAGRMELAVAPVNLDKLLIGVCGMIGELAAEKGLRLTVECGDLPKDLCGDPMRLTQALLNYVGNALKFTERGAVTIRCRAVDESADSVLVKFEVADTGNGISLEAMGRLFKAFEQADNSMTRSHGGTGLGLAITRHLAELMGGAAGGESVPGSGSTFWFTARLQRDARPAALHDEPTGRTATVGKMDAAAHLRQRHGGARILLAEDEPVNREIAHEMLLDAGLDPVFAVNGEDAVAAVSRGDCDLVLMDMQMPIMDGLAATRAIRALPAYNGLPIIAMTANAFDDDRQRCFAAGMDDFIAKPFDPDTLYQLIQQWLDRGPV